MKKIEDIVKDPRVNAELVSGGMLIGSCAVDEALIGSITVCGIRCSVVATWEDEHVSIAPYNGTIPTWDMMCKLKDIFFDEEEEAYQIHPKKSQYVNAKKNCLHLWGKIGGM